MSFVADDKAHCRSTIYKTNNLPKALIHSFVKFEFLIITTIFQNNQLNFNTILTC